MAMAPWVRRARLRGVTLAAMTAAAVPIAMRYTQPWSATEMLGASSATATPRGTASHGGGRCRRQSGAAQPRAKGHSVKVNASGEGCSWVTVTITPHSSTINPVNTARCCGAHGGCTTASRRSR